jgi:hypothetical protein
MQRSSKLTESVVVRLVTVLPAALVVVTPRPVIVLPAASVVMTAPLGWLALAGDPVAAEMVLVTLVRVLPAVSVTGPVTPTMVLPAVFVVVTASLVLVIVLPAASVVTTGAPGMPVLATPRRALMAEPSEAKLGWYWEGTAVR